MGDLKEKQEAQRQYCRETKTPRFAPTDGICWSCHKQIYSRISLEMASTRLITGCPHCHYSFCE